MSFVEPVEKGGETDATGHGVELGHRKAIFREQQVRSQHGGKTTALAGIARMFDQAAGFAAIQILRHPRRLKLAIAEQVLSRRRSQVEVLQRLVKMETCVPDLFEFGDLRRT